MDRNPLVARLGGLSVVAAGGLALLYVAAVRTPTGQTLDDAAFAGRTSAGSVTRHRSWQLLSHISIGSLFVAVLLMVSIALVRRRPRLAVAAGAVVGLSVGAAELLKVVVLSPRPVLIASERPSFNTFPGGHTTVAMATAVGFVIVLPSAVRGVAALCGGIYATLIGVATQAAGWHRPSDAVGSYLLVLAVACAVLAVLVARRGTRRAPPRRFGVLPPLIPLVALAGYEALIVVVRGGRTLRVVRDGLPLDGPLVARAYDAGVGAVNAAGALCMLLFVAVLAGAALDPRDPAAPQGIPVSGGFPEWPRFIHRRGLVSRGG